MAKAKKKKEKKGSIKTKKETKNKEKKGKWEFNRKTTIITCTIVLVLSLCLCVFSAILLSLSTFFTSADIPVVSDITEKVEKTVVDPKTTVVEDQNYFADMVVEFLEPATEEDGMSYDEYIDQLNEIMENFNYENQEMPSNSNGKLEVFGYSEDNSKEDSDMYVVVNYDNTNDNENLRNHLVMDGKVEFQGVSFEADGEIIIQTGEQDLSDFYNFEGQEIYMKLNSFPMLDTLASESDMDIKGKWWKISMDEYMDLMMEETEMDIEDIETQIDENFNLKIEQEDLDKIEEILRSETILGEVKWEDDRVIDGKRTRCKSMTWKSKDLENIIEELRTFEEIDESLEGQEKEIKEMTDAFKEMKVTTCNDRAKGNLYELGFYLNLEIPEDIYDTSYRPYNSEEKTDSTNSYIEIQSTMNYSGYGEKVNVDLPEESENLIKYIMDIYEIRKEQVKKSQDELTVRVESQEFYTLYVSDSCDSCDEVEAYLKDEKLENKHMFVTINVDDSFSGMDYRSRISRECGKDYEFPLLEISNFSAQDFDDMVQCISGSEAIKEYFEQK